MIHEPFIRSIIISEHSDGEKKVGIPSDGTESEDHVVYISKAFMLIGCVFLASLRVAIPLLILLLRERGPGRARRIRL